MQFARPKTETLKVSKDGETFKKEIYLKPDILNGVVDEDYPKYDDDTTYNVGDYVIVDELKTIYKCSDDNVKGKFPPAHPEIWVAWGFVNSYKMLSTDEQIGAKTEGKDIEMIVPFSQCDVLGIINTLTTSIDLQQIVIYTGYLVGIGNGSETTFFLGEKNIIEDTLKVYIDGDETSDYTLDAESGKITFDTPPDNNASITADYKFIGTYLHFSGKDIGCLSFAEYFYDEIKDKTRFIIELEWYPNAYLKLKFNGDTEIGSLVVGRKEELGITLMGTKLTFSDKSKIKIDEFTGFRQVIRYGHVRVLKADVAFDVNTFNVVAQKIAEIIGKNILFIPSKDDTFSEMTNIAYIENMDMPIENPKIFKSSISIVGVI